MAEKTWTELATELTVEALERFDEGETSLFIKLPSGDIFHFTAKKDQSLDTLVHQLINESGIPFTRVVGESEKGDWEDEEEEKEESKTNTTTLMTGERE